MSTPDWLRENGVDPEEALVVADAVRAAHLSDAEIEVVEGFANDHEITLLEALVDDHEWKVEQAIEQEERAGLLALASAWGER